MTHLHYQSRYLIYQTLSLSVSAESKEAKEEWRYVDQHKQDEFKSGPFSHWPFGAGELVKNAQKVIKASFLRMMTLYPVNMQSCFTSTDFMIVLSWKLGTQAA